MAFRPSLEFYESEHYEWSNADGLGRGAGGVVFKGYEKVSGNAVAVKMFKANEESKSRQREFSIMSKLKHENIVKFYAYENEVRKLQRKVLVMELCSGGTLQDYLARPENGFGLTESEFLNVLSHLSSGLTYLRDEAIIHRDIKALNILICITDDGRNVYKLADFGAAREIPEDAYYYSIWGSPAYLAPEVHRVVATTPRNEWHLNKKKFIAQHADMWSLGMTLYQAATGRLPFRPPKGNTNGIDLSICDMIYKKESGVISGVQNSPNGPITWSRTLPKTCHLSSSVQRATARILAGLLESDPVARITYSDYLEAVEKLLASTRADTPAYCVNTGQLQANLCVDTPDRIDSLKSALVLDSDPEATSGAIASGSLSLSDVVVVRSDGTTLSEEDPGGRLAGSGGRGPLIACWSPTKAELTSNETGCEDGAFEWAVMPEDLLPFERPQFAAVFKPMDAMASDQVKGSGEDWITTCHNTCKVALAAGHLYVNQMEKCETCSTMMNTSFSALWSRMEQRLHAADRDLSILQQQIDTFLLLGNQVVQSHEKLQESSGSEAPTLTGKEKQILRSVDEVRTSLEDRARTVVRHRATSSDVSQKWGIERDNIASDGALKRKHADTILNKLRFHKDHTQKLQTHKNYVTSYEKRVLSYNMRKVQDLFTRLEQLATVTSISLLRSKHSQCLDAVSSLEQIASSCGGILRGVQAARKQIDTLSRQFCEEAKFALQEVMEKLRTVTTEQSTSQSLLNPLLSTVPQPVDGALPAEELENRSLSNNFSSVNDMYSNNGSFELVDDVTSAVQENTNQLEKLMRQLNVVLF